MARKFNRDYRIAIDTIQANADIPSISGAAILGALNAKSVEIGPPFTVEFDMVQTNGAGLRTLDLTLYNLSLAARSLLRKDVYPVDRAGYLDERQIEFWAGYAGSVPASLQDYYQNQFQIEVAQKQSRNYPTIFRGIITRAYSYSEGHSPNAITRIECVDNGTSQIIGDTNRPYAKGTSIRKILTDLIYDIPRVTVGAIGDFDRVLPRGRTFTGNPVDAIFELTEGKFFIYNQKGYCLKDNEYLKGPIPTIGVGSGLIGTPRIDANTITATLLFEPGLVFGQGIELKTETIEGLNGFYKIVGIQHRGIISPTVSGQALTTVEMTNAYSLTESKLTLVEP